MPERQLALKLKQYGDGNRNQCNCDNGNYDRHFRLLFSLRLPLYEAYPGADLSSHAFRLSLPIGFGSAQLNSARILCQRQSKVRHRSIAAAAAYPSD
jgi:hypothetical protein